MVDDKEIKSINFTVDFDYFRNSKLVTGSQMKKFGDNNKLLASKINQYILMYEQKNKLSRNKTYEEMIEKCQQSSDTFKKIISGKIRITRCVLYKFCIGMDLSLEQANELFSLSEEGALTENNIGDYIFLHALGKDSIYSFIDEYERYVGKKIGLRDRQ